MRMDMLASRQTASAQPRGLTLHGAVSRFALRCSTGSPTKLRTRLPFMFSTILAGSGSHQSHGSTHRCGYLPGSAAAITPASSTAATPSRKQVTLRILLLWNLLKIADPSSFSLRNCACVASSTIQSPTKSKRANMHIYTQPPEWHDQLPSRNSGCVA